MILDELAAYASFRVAEAKKKIAADEMERKARSLPKGDFRFEHALCNKGVSFICEVKRASPSKGLIAEDFPYVEIAREYEQVGADCVSVLTEPKWFLGSDEIFKEIRAAITLPMIRKDFTVDAYQIYEAKCMGADAVLLICALLPTETIREYLKICDDLGLTALVETHDENEIQSALKAGARVIGVNNRNLKNFTVDFSNAANLREQIPTNVIFVAESGVKEPQVVGVLAEIGADAVLFGEALMRAEDKTERLAEFKQAAVQGREKAAEQVQTSDAQSQASDGGKA